MTPIGDLGYLPASVRGYLDALTERVRSVVAGDLMGIYAIGSIAFGEYRHGPSDVDVAVVTSRRLDDARRGRLVELLSHDALPCPARRLELVVYPLEAVGQDPPTLVWDLNLNTGRDAPTHAGTDPATEDAHWFVLDVAIARSRAVPLLGPFSRDVFAPISRTRVLAALVESLVWHAGEEPRSPNSVLNACRGWRFAEEGVWSSKADAARWARPRVEQPALLDRAMEALDNARFDALNPAETGPFLERVRALIARAAANEPL
jgi:hypothetical protein